MSKIVRDHTAQTFEEVYKGGYDKNYPSIDLVRLEAWYLKRKPGRVLDYGCGPGTNGLHLLDNGYEVVFTDVAREALKKVEQKLAKRPDSRHRASTRPVDLAADVLPDADASFDYVIALSVLGNLESADSVRHLLTEFHRILKPGGKIICDICGVDSTYVHAGTQVGKDTYSTQPRAGFESDSIIMYFPESAEVFAGLVRSAGFTVDDVGHLSWSYMGHSDYEYIVCAHKAP